MELVTPQPARPGLAARLVGRPLFWVVAVALLFGVPLGRSLLRRVPPEQPMLGTLPAFAFTDQEGHPFGTKELAGKVWVADFIFTACAEACPLLTQKMAEIGKRTQQLGPELHLVSLTVDPERDTPARLAEYAARYHANPRKWSFLTGPMTEIEAAVTGGFKIGMGREKSGEFWEIFHGEQLVLVDRQLRIRGYFSATPEGMDKLVDAIASVVNRS